MNKWIQQITEITPLAHSIFHLVQENNLDKAQKILPKEQPYSSELAKLTE